MTPRIQRLIIILFSLTFVTISIVLILINSKNNLVFFFTPTELLDSKITTETQVRIGGFVKKDSLLKNIENNIYSFIVTDNQNDIEVEFKGILPNLLKEGQGEVVEGTLISKKKLVALKVFAKHDENYMPSSIKKQLKNSDYWKKDYSEDILFDEKLPNFKIINLFDKTKVLSKFDIRNKQVLINFFASWCVPCKKELPLLFLLKDNQPNLMIIGIDHKDIKSNVLKFFKEGGNPYNFVGVDNNGNIGLEFGVLGLPETFLIDDKGNIIFKHIGPLTKKIVHNKIIPLLD